MLRVDLTKRLGDFELRATLEVPRGITVLEGPSGAGKTTLLRAIAGLLRPDVGHVELDGRVLSDARTFIAPHLRDVGFVFADYALFPHLSVRENVAFGLRARGIRSPERARRVATLLERFEIVALADRRIDEISGGQRQRVALARSLIVEPRALLLDEPLAALDRETRGRVRGELATFIGDLKIPTILVSHDAEDRALSTHAILSIAHGIIDARPSEGASAIVRPDLDR